MKREGDERKGALVMGEVKGKREKREGERRNSLKIKIEFNFF